MSYLHYIDIFFRQTLVPLSRLSLRVNSKSQQLAEELRRRARNIKLEKNIGESHAQWLDVVSQLKNKITNDDPKDFLQWDLIRKTMFIGNALFVFKEFLYLFSHNWKYWKKVLPEKGYIPFEPYLLYPRTSGNLIHYAYHICKFEKVLGKKIKDFDFILEYGGGYGGLCQLIYNLGFMGKYAIFDFAVLSALQTYYLKMNKLNAACSMKTKGKIRCLSDVKDIRKVWPKKERKLFIATWSLSESPIGIRKKFFPMVGNADAFLIAFQDYFGGVDNKKYFKEFQKMIPRVAWWSEEIKQLNGNFYLFGYRREVS